MSIRKQPQQYLRNKWFTQELRTTRAIGRKMLKRWQKTRSNTDLLLYHQHQQRYKKDIQMNKKAFIQAQITKGTNKTKALFRSLKDFTRNPDDQKFTPTNPSSYCEQVAEYFSNKVRDIRTAIDSSPPSSEVEETSRDTATGHLPPCNPEQTTPRALGHSTPTSLLTFQPVSQEEIRNIIKSLGPASSVLDPLPTETIKTVIDVLLPDITEIVNKSLTTGVVPLAWKKGVITPLVKKTGADPMVMKNLRPVTQLRLLPRITEAIVTAQIRNHLEQEKILHDHQSGFRPGRGTELTVADVREDLLWCADMSHPALLVLLDLSAAFDTVDHNILVERLQEVGGFGGTALKWLSSFLSERSQMVKWEEVLSKERPLPWGVPQGSALSPLLFNVYLRPLATLLESSGLRFHMYADDTQILVDLHDDKGEADRLVPCLTLLREWMRQNKLCLNETKTELLAVRGNRAVAFPRFPWPESWGPPPTPSTRIRDLGVEISHHLDGDAHANATVRTCNLQLNILSRVFPLLTIKQRKQLYQALVGSKISYGLTSLLGATKKTVFKVQKIQNRAIRLIFALNRRQHLSPWRQKLGWLTIEAQISSRICHWLWKVKHKLGPRYIHRWAGSYHTMRPRRKQQTHVLPPRKYQKETKGGRSIAGLGCHLWNSLPLQVRELSSLDAFKTALKYHFLRQEADRKGLTMTRSPMKPQAGQVERAHQRITSRATRHNPGIQTSGLSERMPGTAGPRGLTSPPLPLRNNFRLIQEAQRNKNLNILPSGLYAPRNISVT